VRECLGALVVELALELARGKAIIASRETVGMTSFRSRGNRASVCLQDYRAYAFADGKKWKQCRETAVSSTQLFITQLHLTVLQQQSLITWVHRLYQIITIPTCFFLLLFSIVVYIFFLFCFNYSNWNIAQLIKERPYLK